MIKTAGISMYHCMQIASKPVCFYQSTVTSATAKLHGDQLLELCQCLDTVINKAIITRHSRHRELDSSILSHSQACAAHLIHQKKICSTYCPLLST